MTDLDKASSGDSQEEDHRSIPDFTMADLDHALSGANPEDHLVLITFVGRCKGVKNVKKSLKSTFKLAKEIMPAGGVMFSICENFDTYQKGGLYPLLHFCRHQKVVEKTKETEHFLEEDALGEELVVDQALFQEVARIEIPGSDASEFVLTVAAFRSIERKPNAKLLKTWKVGIRQPSDEGLVMDVLQRFRVGRWFGYQTIYRPYIR